MSTKPYETQLSKIGLSDKEAKVYLASLEIGPSSVQKISQKASVKRATTYVAIEGLIGRGLMSSFYKDKKRLFSAEPPQALIEILEDEKKSIISRQEIVKQFLPDLIALNSAGGKKPSVSFYEGLDGLRAIHEDVLASKADCLDNIVALDDFIKVELDNTIFESFRQKLIKKGTEVRILYSSENTKPQIPSELVSKWKTKKIKSSILPIHGELTVYGNKVAAFSYRGKIFGTIIESEDVAGIIRALFEMAWRY